MAQTDHCDLYGEVHEEAINRLIRHLMRQRPSMFNFATPMFHSNPELLCVRPDIHPEVARRGLSICSLEQPLPISGTGNTLGLNYCLQITELRLDAHPNNVIPLPPQLANLMPEQRLALSAKACAGLVCPLEKYTEHFGGYDTLPGSDNEQGSGTPSPLPGELIHCFCLELMAVLHAEYKGRDGQHRVSLVLDGLELVDVRPEELENSLECWAATVFHLAILPRLRFTVSNLVLNLDQFATLTISPTQISRQVPFNPAVEDDKLKVFINAEVS
ncbi:MAG: hypothetical protein KKE73_08905 [Proteobacteria bacterium]|nr:hypothetical protein [Pseudomonadota bacterium]